MVLYSSIGVVICGMVYYELLDEAAPLSAAFAYHGLPWAQGIVAFGAFFALTTSILVCLMGMPRIFLAMARDGLFFQIFQKIHPRFNTPFYGTLITGAVASILSLLLDIHVLADMVSIGTLMAFLYDFILFYYLFIYSFPSDIVLFVLQLLF